MGGDGTVGGGCAAGGPVGGCGIDADFASRSEASIEALSDGCLFSSVGVFFSSCNKDLSLETRTSRKSISGERRGLRARELILEGIGEQSGLGEATYVRRGEISMYAGLTLAHCSDRGFTRGPPFGRRRLEEGGSGIM